MHTVFVNDHPFRLVNAYEAEEWKGSAKSIFIAQQDMGIEEAMKELEEAKEHPGMIYMTANPDVDWQLLISYCTLIEASGGLVMNEHKEYLIIFRKGKYDLPKGKLEYDETPEEGGIREVKEECGLRKVEIVKPLDKTFHTYQVRKHRMLKKTHWFLMKSADQILIPQQEEEIERAEWMKASDVIGSVLNNTYASIAELLRKSLGA